MNRVKKQVAAVGQRLFMLFVTAVLLAGITAVVGITSDESPLSAPEAEAAGTGTWDMGTVDYAQCSPAKVAVIFDDAGKGSTSYFQNSDYWLVHSAQGASNAVEAELVKALPGANVELGIFMAERDATLKATSSMWDAANHKVINNSGIAFTHGKDVTGVTHNWEQVFTTVKNAGYTDVLFITGYRPTTASGEVAGRFDTTQNVLDKTKAAAAGFNSFTAVGLSTPYYNNQYMNSTTRAQAGLSYIAGAGNVFFQPAANRDGDGVRAAMPSFINKIKAALDGKEACVIARKSQVNVAGDHVSALQGWTFKVNGASATTNTSGLTYFPVDVANGATTQSTTIEETLKDNYLYRGARCQQIEVAAASGSIGTSVTGVTQKRTAITSTIGTNTATVTVSPYKMYQCDIQNVPTVPVTVNTALITDNNQIRVKLKENPYTYSAACTWKNDSGTTQTFSFDDLTLASSERESTDPKYPSGDTLKKNSTTLRVPIGSTCTFTQKTPRVVDDSRFSSSTGWSNTGGVEATANDNSYTVKVGDQAATNGSMTVTATNTYNAKFGSISYSASQTGLDNAAAFPSDIKVIAKCRYLASFDPDNPPQQQTSGLGEIVSFPDTEFEIGGASTNNPLSGFPVGTQCVYEVETDVSVPGYTYKVELNSNTCTQANSSDILPDAGAAMRQCPQDSTMVVGEGAYQAKFNFAYTRGESIINVKKAWTGDGASEASSLEYPFTVTCGGDYSETFKLKGGQSNGVSVPAYTDCTISEGTDGVTVPSTISVTTAEPKTITSPDVNGTTEVTFTNNATWNRGDMTFNLAITDNVAASGLTTDEQDALRTTLDATTYNVAVTCTWADSMVQGQISYTVTNGDTFGTSGIPYGSSCFAEITGKSSAPEGVTFTSNRQSFTFNGTGPVTVTGNWDVTQTHMTVGHEYVINGATPADAATLFADMPQTSGTLTCTSTAGENLSLQGQDAKQVFVINPTDDCTFSNVTEQLVAGFTVETKLVVNGVEQDPSASFTAVTNGTMASVVVRHIYTPIMHTVTVAATKTVNNGDTGQPEDTAGAVYEAAFKNYSATQTVTCTRNGVEVFSSTMPVVANQDNSFIVPDGAECTISQSASGYSATQTKAADNVVTTVTNDAPFSMAEEYQVEYGTFNMKKKVDGEGVATVTNDKKFAYTYVCTLNGVTVKEGTFSGGRFDAPYGSAIADNNLESLRATGIPVGSDCTITEDADSAKLDPALHKARWTVATGATGWEPETACAGVANCQDLSEMSIKLSIKPADSLSLSDGTTLKNFQGTVVNWNTYTYPRLNMKVAKVVDGNNAYEAKDAQFTVNLTCKSPGQLSGGVPDQVWTNLAGMNGSATLKGGQSSDLTYISENSQVNMSVPVGFVCAIAEDAPASTFGGTMTSTFAAASADGALTQTDNGFVLPTDIPAGGKDVTFTVTNTFERPRVNLTVAKKVDNTVANDVSGYLLTGNNATFDIAWKCHDAALKKDYQGTLTLGGDGSPAPIVIPGEAEGQTHQLPQGVTCTTSENPASKLVAGNNRIKYVDPVVTQTVGTEESKVSLTQDGSIFSTAGLELKNDVATVWTNGYYADDVIYSLRKSLENIPDDLTQAQKDELNAYAFDFGGTCTIPSDMGFLEGEQGATLPDGTNTTTVGEHPQSFTLANDKATSFKVPRGTTCALSEAAPDYSTAPLSYLAEKHLTMGASVGDSETDRTQVDYGDTSITVPFEQTTNTQSGDPTVKTLTDVTVFNTIYRDKAPIEVEQVDVNFDGLKGSAFAIYRAAGTGMESDPVAIVTNTDATRGTAYLAPGTYYLVQTKAANGAALLPNYWKFSVTANTDPYQDLEVSLAAETENSGLVTLTAAGENTNWLIQVANVMTGALPLTGGIGLWWLFGLGGAALVASFIKRKN